MLRRKIGLTLLFFFTVCVSSAFAIPDLQIYLPDAEYDTDSESWVTDSPDFRLDVIGANYEIIDVKIALAVPTNQDGTITVSGYNDSGIWTSYTLHEGLTPDDPVDFEMADADFGDAYFMEDGTPLMGDGSEVPGGGVFPTSYYQFYLGDFGLDTTVHNYIPGEDYLSTADGHIEELFITVSGYTSVNIIAYDHVVLSNNKVKYVKNPYSHDGIYAIPEPSTFLLLGFGLVGLGVLGYRRRKHL